MKTDQELRKIKRRNTLILWLIGYLILVFLSLHVGVVLNSYDKFDYTSLMKCDKDVVESIKSTPFFVPKISEFKVLFFTSLLYFAFFLYCRTFTKKYRLGKEHGSSKWGDKDSIEKLVDKNGYNMILTETEKVSLDTRITRKNNNTIIIGSPGTGKTRYYVKPNLLQANCSYVITDPKGELLEDTGDFFLKHGYKIKILNLKDMDCSMCYNPFSYVEKETDIIKVIDCLICNTNKNQNSTSDPFWEKAEIALLQAIFFYIYYEIVEEEHNFNTVMELVRLAEAKEDDEGFKSDLDIIFEQLKQEKPNHIACKQYKIFKMGAGKTIKSILISLGVRLSVFNINAVSNLMIKDELELNKIGNEKTVLFVIIPDATDTTFNFIAAMMYTQLFDTLYKVADSSKDRRLKFHTRCILDEFANIGKIPNFDKLITTMRSREISVAIIIQAMSQIKEMYEKNWEGVIGTCEYMLFLGSQEQSTLNYVSKFVGKETIDTRNINNSKGRQGSTTWNYGTTGRELMTPDEVGRMPDDYCILKIRGMFSFFSKKYNLYNHVNYKYLADASEKNMFNLNLYKNSINEKQSEEEREKILEHYDIEEFTLELNELENMYNFSLDRNKKDENIIIEENLEEELNDITKGE